MRRCGTEAGAAAAHNPNDLGEIRGESHGGAWVRFLVSLAMQAKGQRVIAGWIFASGTANGLLQPGRLFLHLVHTGGGGCGLHLGARHLYRCTLDLPLLRP